MGNTKETSSGSQSQSTQYTPTAAEQEMQNLQLGQYKQTVEPQTQAQLQGLNLISQLLAGGSLPGYLSILQKGISPEAIGNQATKMALQSGVGFQSMGLSDSGTAFKETSRSIASELLYPTEQYNIGAFQNLLNLALSGQASVQQPIQAGTGTLAQSLAGLRSVSQTGTTSQRAKTSYDIFTSPFTSALLGGAQNAAGMGTEAYGKMLWA